MALKKLQTLFKDTLTGLFYSYNNNGTDLEQVNLGSGSVTSVTGSSPITVTNSTTTPNISIATASPSTTGVLTSTDWNVFNSKTSNGVTDVTTTKPIVKTKVNNVVDLKLEDPFTSFIDVPLNGTYTFDCREGFNKRLRVHGNFTLTIDYAESGMMGTIIILAQDNATFTVTLNANPATPYLETNQTFTDLDSTTGTYIITWVKGTDDLDFDEYYFNIAVYKNESQW